jgi:hypothetical protein
MPKRVLVPVVLGTTTLLQAHSHPLEARKELKAKADRGLQAVFSCCCAFNETGVLITSPGLESKTPLLGERGCVRQFNSSSRLRIASPYFSRALQSSQSRCWILRRDNR